MNNVTIVGKCKNITKINPNKYIINIISSSPINKKIAIPIYISKSDFINKIQTNDLIGINGYIDISDDVIILIALKITWLPQKKVSI